MLDALKTLALPPINLILVILAGLVLRRTGRRWGMAVVVAACAALYLLCTPVVSTLLVWSLEAYPALRLDHVPAGPAAIVVLSAGRMSDAPDYGGEDTVGPLTLVRLRYAAALYRQTGLPVLVSGGSGGDEGPPMADLMTRSLAEDFAVPVRWQEPASANTAENAVNSARILAAEGIGTVFLVTHAWHMQRAVWAFDTAGLTVVPAPTAFRTPTEADFGQRLEGYVASPVGLAYSAFAVHEWVGLLWYRLRYG